MRLYPKKKISFQWRWVIQYLGTPYQWILYSIFFFKLITVKKKNYCKKEYFVFCEYFVLFGFFFMFSWLHLLQCVVFFSKFCLFLRFLFWHFEILVLFVFFGRLKTTIKFTQRSFVFFWICFYCICFLCWFTAVVVFLFLFVCTCWVQYVVFYEFNCVVFFMTIVVSCVFFVVGVLVFEKANNLTATHAWHCYNDKKKPIKTKHSQFLKQHTNLIFKRCYFCCIVLCYGLYVNTVAFVLRFCLIEFSSLILDFFIFAHEWTRLLTFLVKKFNKIILPIFLFTTYEMYITLTWKWKCTLLNLRYKMRNNQRILILFECLNKQQQYYF